jgi:uncharacterized protein with FMN-binding domain
MRKGIVAILAVAIIGALGIYSNGHKSDASAIEGANTSASNTPTASATRETTNPTATETSNTASGAYKDGTYTGVSQETEYGTIQVAAVVSGGRITDIEFLQMPGPEGNSKQVTAFSEQPLKQSALNKQSAHIDFVSGATTTSEAYEQSLQAALDQAA